MSTARPRGLQASASDGRGPILRPLPIYVWKQGAKHHHCEDAGTGARISTIFHVVVLHLLRPTRAVFERETCSSWSAPVRNCRVWLQDPARWCFQIMFPFSWADLVGTHQVARNRRRFVKETKSLRSSESRLDSKSLGPQHRGWIRDLAARLSWARS